MTPHLFALRLLLIITDTDTEKSINHLFTEAEQPIYYQFRAQGTAKTEILDICGLDGSTRVITAALIPKSKISEIFEMLEKYGIIDEEHGLLTVEKIKETCAPLFEQYGVKYAYLFGSYAKKRATEQSDVDLLISMPVNGLRFYELVEALREALKKRVDLLDETQLDNNNALVKEILQDGIKIYG